ncbi:helix-turn-helix domain-containing protein [Nocardiopsis algeriensis]|uniref:Transcriptional regulator with XRE-family HTH domain n=1 Tax=Nocardiopsis algeriensis TaxID=1478215 RepID=A0A841IND6_9ACTN|nr:Scr1 family TA system antitoxin-like transcriptional regulator [Nocardiopsis algeriensis]MBB6118786.1 transcriptional regulator with XRE-family HTH domain [Nocardiopsis algeriensis]
MGSNMVLPSAMWLPFGTRVLNARSDKGLSLVELAASTGVGGDKLRDVEAARCRPARSLVERIDTALGGGSRLVEAWAVTLQAEAFPDEFGDLGELTVHATRVWETRAETVPSFLRTREYSRAVLRPRWPGLSDKEVEALVDEEMYLRAVVTGPGGPALRAVLAESAFQDPEVDPGVLRAQRCFLADLVEAGIVSLAVIPETSPRGPAQSGDFRFLEFHARPGMAYAFAAEGGELLTDIDHVERCCLIRDALEDVAVELTPDSALLAAE